MTTWGERSRFVRAKLGLKQSTLASILGVDQGTVSRWEVGARAPNLAAKRWLEEQMSTFRVSITAAAVSMSPSMVMVYDSDSRILLASQSLQEVGFFTSAKIIDFMGAELVRSHARTVSAGLFDGEPIAVRVAHLSSRGRAIECLRTAVEFNGETVCLSQSSSISELQYEHSLPFQVIKLR